MITQVISKEGIGVIEVLIIIMNVGLKLTSYYWKKMANKNHTAVDCIHPI